MDCSDTCTWMIAPGLALVPDASCSWNCYDDYTVVDGSFVVAVDVIDVLNLLIFLLYSVDVNRYCQWSYHVLSLISCPWAM